MRISTSATNRQYNLPGAITAPQRAYIATCSFVDYDQTQPWLGGLVKILQFYHRHDFTPWSIQYLR
jgi:hypothetical protein